MSLILDRDVKQYQSLDPRLEVDKQRGFVITKGAENQTQQVVVSQNYDNTQITWTVIPPSKRTVIDRKFTLAVPIQIQFAGTALNGGTALLNLQDGSNAPRFLPLSSVISNASLSMNNTSFTINTRESIAALLKYNVDAEETLLSGESLLLQDNYASYDQAVGNNNNPLNPYPSSSYFSLGRGSFNDFINVVSNTSTAATIQFTIIEELYLSPCNFHLDDQSGFVYINNLELQIQLSNLSRVWSSSAATQPFTSVTASVYANPSMYLTYLSPPINMQIPAQVPYSFQQVNQYTTNCGTIAAGAQFTQQASSIQLGVIPSAILIFAQPSTSAYSYTLPSTFAAMNSISINFNNKSGILSSATPYQLYQIARRNGLLSCSYNQWLKRSGSVLMLRPDRDLGLNALQAPGLANFNGNLDVTATFTNLFSQSVQFTMYIVTISDGVMTCYADGNIIQQVSVVTSEDVANSSSLPYLPESQLNQKYGGSFFDVVKGVWNFIKDNKLLSKGARAIASALPQTAPVANVIGDVAEKLGAGRKRGGGKLTMADLKKLNRGE